MPAQGWLPIFVLCVRKLVSLFVRSSQSPLRSTVCSEVKWRPKFYPRTFWALTKWKSMILSGHAKGNGGKLVIEFLSTLESTTSWLDIWRCYVWAQHEKPNFLQLNDSVKSTKSFNLHNFTPLLLKVKFSFTTPLRVHVKLAKWYNIYANL